MPFLAAMEIAKDESNFDYENIEQENRDRLFKASEIDPMNSNIAFVLYRTSFKKSVAARFPRYYLKAFRNEKAIRLKACGYEKNCDLKKFLSYYKDFTNKCQSAQEACRI